MGDSDRPSASIECEIGANCGPQAAIFLGPQSDLAGRVIGISHIVDVNDALSAGQRRPDRPRPDVPPGRRIEIDMLLARSEGEPSNVRWYRGEVALWNERRPI